MKRSYQISGSVCFVFAAFMAWQSLRMDYYTRLGPGPGFFPFWLSVLFGLLAGITVYQATFGAAPPMPLDFIAGRAGYLRVVAILLALSATIVLMKPLGFRLTMLSFIAFLLVALGRQNLILTAVVALAGSFGVYHAFVQWLHVPLPTGMFGI